MLRALYFERRLSALYLFLSSPQGVYPFALVYAVHCVTRALHESHRESLDAPAPRGHARYASFDD